MLTKLVVLGAAGVGLVVAGGALADRLPGGIGVRADEVVDGIRGAGLPAASYPSTRRRVASGAPFDVTARCADGSRAVAGGYLFPPGGAPQIRISAPAAEGRGWRVAGTAAAAGTVTVRAVCLPSG